jgi:hypothetical protein
MMIPVPLTLRARTLLALFAASLAVAVARAAEPAMPALDRAAFERWLLDRMLHEQPADDGLATLHEQPPESRAPLVRAGVALLREIAASDAFQQRYAAERKLRVGEPPLPARDFKAPRPERDREARERERFQAEQAAYAKADAFYEKEFNAALRALLTEVLKEIDEPRDLNLAERAGGEARRAAEPLLREWLRSLK